jgi:hypothetical protein
MKRSGLLVAICFFTGMILCPDRCYPSTRILKTAYKTYTVGTWQGIDILCEPYQVKKNDWIYKIFKKKGSLSGIDFPLFLNIFKHLNPHIPNPNNIRPGQQISIPLKKIDPRDSPSGSKARVIVPILQMSELAKKIDIDSFTQQHQVKAGGQLHRSETLSPQTRNMEKIRHYAAIVQGELLNKGTYYLPGPRQKDIPLNLPTTPIVQLENNSKIIILPHNFPQADFLRSLKGFWQNVSFMDMDTVEKKLIDTPLVSVLPRDRSSALAMLVQKAKFDLLPYETTLQMEGGINIPIKAHRVPKDNQPDLLIFLGSIYGNALTLLKHQGFAIISIPPSDEVMEMGRKLFEALDISTVLNPVFMNKTTRQSMSIPGLFVGDGKNLFISSQPLNPAIRLFFAKNRVAMLHSNENQSPDKEITSLYY